MFNGYNIWYAGDTEDNVIIHGYFIEIIWIMLTVIQG